MKNRNEITNVSIVLANLAAGGAERVLSFIAQGLDKSKYNCTLVIIGNEKDAAYDIQGIEVVYFEKPRVLSGIFSLFVYLIKCNPDIVVSAVAHLNTVTAYLSFFFPNTKFIAREVAISSVADSINKRNKSIIEYFAKKRFAFTDRIICQSQDMKQDLLDNNVIDIDKMVVINNPISDGFVKKTNYSRSETIRLITVGSFKKIKGHHRIIMALANLKIPFHYTLVGDGSEKENLFGCIDEYDLSSKVTHIPFTKNVAEYLRQSDLFLQGSYSEGFPNALIESCAVGVPVLAFKAPGGHNEIIIEGVNGHIVENEGHLTNKIKELHESFYFDLDIVVDSVQSRFRKDLILSKYEELFDDVLD